MIVDHWLDWAERKPGPWAKVYSEPNANRGFVPHSQVGTVQGAWGRLFSEERDPEDPSQYSDYAAASWHLTLHYSGKVTQHYPFTASCWTSGSRYPNTSFPTVEIEGGAVGNESEPLTPGQLDALVRIIHDLSQHYNWFPERPANAQHVTASLYVHRECVRWGSAPTACESGRVPWVEVFKRLTAKEDDLSAEQFDQVMESIEEVKTAMRVLNNQRKGEIAQLTKDIQGVAGLANSVRVRVDALEKP